MLAGCSPHTKTPAYSPTPSPTATASPTASPSPTPRPTLSPTPSPTPTPGPYVYTFDPYALPEQYIRVYGEEFEAVYRAFVDAYLGFETAIVCPTRELAWALWDSLRTICLPFFCDGVIPDVEKFYDPETLLFSWTYSSHSKAEHDAKLALFAQTVSSYLTPDSRVDDPDWLRAMIIYRNFSSAVVYDETALDENRDVSPYRALMNQVGICQGFAGAYAYLLRQAGIEAIECGGLTYDASTAHDWVLVKLDGQWFYMDPTFENSDTFGLGLYYFGMTAAEREAAGGYDPELFNIGSLNQIWGPSLDVSDERFAPLRKVSTFTVQRQTRTLHCRTFTGGSFEVPFDQFEKE